MGIQGTAINIRSAYGEADRQATRLDIQSFSKIFPASVDDHATLALLDECTAAARAQMSKPQRMAIKSIKFSFDPLNPQDLNALRGNLLVMMAFRQFRVLFVDKFAHVLSDLAENLSRRDALDDLKKFKPIGICAPDNRLVLN